MSATTAWRTIGCGSLLMLAACAQLPTLPAQDRYALQITDNAADRRFDLALQSRDARPLCVSVESWPSRVGQLHMGSDLATLQTAADSLPARDENFGYCPGGCGEHRIEPGGTLRGFIAYDAFGDASQLAADADKRLQFSVMPHYCQR
ncbi:TPA: hypothetical protein UOJ00_002977 [Stenotrophomonas maltophilia]|nr:hypothetical protein [Stenotrophomonas maltophilia]